MLDEANIFGFERAVIALGHRRRHVRPRASARQEAIADLFFGPAATSIAAPFVTVIENRSLLLRRITRLPYHHRALPGVGGHCCAAAFYAKLPRARAGQSHKWRTSSSGALADRLAVGKRALRKLFVEAIQQRGRLDVVEGTPACYVPSPLDKLPCRVKHSDAAELPQPRPYHMPVHSSHLDNTRFHKTAFLATKIFMLKKNDVRV